MLFNNLSGSRSEQANRHNCAVFGEFVLDFDRGCVQKNGRDVPIRPKSFKVLTHLVTHHGILVSKDELLNAVWPKTVVTEDSLTQCLIEIRKALGDHNKDMIVTLPRRGYLFDMAVSLVHVDGQTSNKRRVAFFSQRRPSIWSAGGLVLVAGLAVIFWWDLQSKVLVPKELASTGKPAALQSAAGQHYLQGRFFQYRRAPGDLDLAISEYRKALAINPDLSLAWLGLGGTYFIKNLGSASADPDEYVQYLQRALELEPDNAEANMRMSNYYFQRSEPEKDAEHLRLALKYGQNDPLVLSMAAGHMMYQLRIKEALVLQRRSVELDPTSIAQHFNLGGFYFFARQFEYAKAEYNMVLELSPASINDVALPLMRLALLQGDLREAERWSAHIIDNRPAAMLAKAILASASGRQTETDDGIALLTLDPNPQAAVKLAEYYAYNHNKDAAASWLNEALVRLQEQPDTYIACELLADAYYSPFLDSLKSEPIWFDWKHQMSLMVPTHTDVNIAALAQFY